jgi:hypothetical protein
MRGLGSAVQRVSSAEVGFDSPEVRTTIRRCTLLANLGTRGPSAHRHPTSEPLTLCTPAPGKS